LTDADDATKRADVVAAARRAHESYLDALDERDRRLGQGHGRITQGSTLRDVQELLRRVDHIRTAINRTPVDGLLPRWDVFEEYLDEDTTTYWRAELAEIDGPVETTSRELVRLLRDQRLLRRFDPDDGDPDDGNPDPDDSDPNRPKLSIAAQMEFCSVVFQRITESRAGQLYVRSNAGTVLPVVSLPLLHPDRVTQILAGSPLSMIGDSGLPFVDPDRVDEVVAVVPLRFYGGVEIPAMQLHASYLGQVLPLVAYGELGFESGERFAPLLERSLEPLYPDSVFDGAGSLQTILARVAAFDASDRGAMLGSVADIIGSVRGLCTTFASIERVARDPTSIEDIGALTVAIIGSLQDARSVVTSVGYISKDTAKTLARRTAWIAAPLLVVDTVTNLHAVRQALDEDDYLLAAGTLLVVGGSVTAGVASLGAAYGWGVFAGPVGAGIVTAGVLTVFIGQSLISLTERDAIEAFSRACMFGANRQGIHVGLGASDMPDPGDPDFEFHDANGRHDPVRQLHALHSLGQPLGFAVDRGGQGSNANRFWSLARHDGSPHPLGNGAQWRVKVVTGSRDDHDELNGTSLGLLIASGDVATPRGHQGEVTELRVVVPRDGIRDLVLYDYATE
jgi:hypothetical protein